MAEPKHTPGPWQSIRSKEPVDGEFDYAISAVGAPVLAEAFGRTADGGYPPTEANARLIAAAPDLLAALRMALPWVAAPLDGADMSASAVAHRAVVAALAKAEA